MPSIFSPGDIFAVRLNDGTDGVGQVLSVEKDALNSVGVVVLSTRIHSQNGRIGDIEPIAAFLTTPDLLKSGVWSVKTKAALILESEHWPYEKFRADHWVGARIIGSANVTELLNAWHGLLPWDDWQDPNHLDGLLLPGVQRPDDVVLKRGS